MTEELYNQAIIEAAKATDHAGRLEAPDGTATADNPLCGDRVTLDLKSRDGCITEIAHKTRGCLLTRAAAALLSRHAEGLPLAKARALEITARAYLDGESDTPPFPELAVMAPVKAVRSRHDCVTIAFDALAEAAEKATRHG
jgi:nitrogen fixation NifU-like protein